MKLTHLFDGLLLVFFRQNLGMSRRIGPLDDQIMIRKWNKQNELSSLSDSNGIKRDKRNKYNKKYTLAADVEEKII